MEIGQKHYVGRVGALAVLLGVGAVITGLPGVAAADTSAPGDTGVSAAPANSAPAPAARRSRGARVDAPDHSSNSGRAGSSNPSRNDSRANAAAVVAGRHLRPQQSETPVPALGISTADTAATRVSTIPSAADNSVPAGSTVTEAIQEIAPAAASPAPAAAEIAAAAPRGTLSGAGSDPALWLGGGTDPLAPLAGPFAWATLAASRRELSGSARTAAPAAAVTTGEPVASETVAAPAIGDFLGNSAVGTALFGAVKGFIVAVATGTDPAEALQTALGSVIANPDVQTAYAPIANAGTTWTALLAETGAPQAVGQATAALLVGLAADTQVQGVISGVLSGAIASALGNNEAAQAAGTTVATAVVGLLSAPQAAVALGGIAGAAVSGLLSQPLLAGAVGGAADLIAAGTSPADAVQAVLAQVQAQATGVVGDAIASAVNAVLVDPSVITALGAATTALATQALAFDEAWTAISDLLGPTYGPVIAGLKDAQGAIERLAALAGTAVTGFLGATGVAAALADTVGQFATALLNGTAAADALQSALGALQAASAVKAALDATVSAALSALLGDPAVQDTVIEGAKNAVFDAIGASGLPPVAVEALRVAVDSLLANPAILALFGDLAGGIVSGTPPVEVALAVAQAVIYDQDLQIAIGSAVGLAIGSLFGDNAVGAIVGQLAGTGATILIGLVAGVARLLNLVEAPAPSAASVGNSFSDGYFVVRGPVLSLAA